MDTIKLLLGATVALLIGALAVSWQGMGTGVKNASADEIARLEKQIKELHAEQESLKVQRDLQTIKNSPSASAAKSSSEVDSLKLQVEQNRRDLEEIERQKAAEALDKKAADEEEVELAKRNLESKDSELRRARLITQSLLVARVKEYVPDPQYGGFITLDILMSEQVQSGTILAIRRKTGILGQFKVTEISSDGAIASPLPGFGAATPQPGDELILPPQY
jgi:hypothetical protein